MTEIFCILLLVSAFIYIICSAGSSDPYYAHMYLKAAAVSVLGEALIATVVSGFTFGNVFGIALDVAILLAIDRHYRIKYGR